MHVAGVVCVGIVVQAMVVVTHALIRAKLCGNNYLFILEMLATNTIIVNWGIFWWSVLISGVGVGGREREGGGGGGGLERRAK